MNIKKKETIWVKYPKITIGSRPNLFVFAPNIPNARPPIISPRPIKIPDKPIYFFGPSADSTRLLELPIAVPYTALKNPNSSPIF